MGRQYNSLTVGIVPSGHDDLGRSAKGCLFSPTNSTGCVRDGLQLSLGFAAGPILYPVQLSVLRGDRQKSQGRTPLGGRTSFGKTLLYFRGCLSHDCSARCVLSRMFSEWKGHGQRPLANGAQFGGFVAILLTQEGAAC